MSLWLRRRDLRTLLYIVIVIKNFMLGFGFDLLRGRDSGFEGKVIARLVIVVVNGTQESGIWKYRFFI